jgi:hypothetical protein
MKRLLLLLLLIGIGYVGYQYYLQSRLSSNVPTDTISGELAVNHVGSGVDNLASVLGASISTMVSTGQEYLSGVTNGASEPVINQLVSKTQEALKDLPKREAEKIKYEFCKDIVTEYESKSTSN